MSSFFRIVGLKRRMCAEREIDISAACRDNELQLAQLSKKEQNGHVQAKPYWFSAGVKQAHAASIQCRQASPTAEKNLSRDKEDET
jgi:hypothetical protein